MTVFDKAKLKIALDTIKNPSKALLGYPSVDQAREIIKDLRGKRK